MSVFTNTYNIPPHLQPAAKADYYYRFIKLPDGDTGQVIPRGAVVIALESNDEGTMYAFVLIPVTVVP